MLGGMFVRGASECMRLHAYPLSMSPQGVQQVLPSMRIYPVLLLLCLVARLCQAQTALAMHERQHTESASASVFFTECLGDRADDPSCFKILGCP